MHANGEARACVYLCQIQREVVSCSSVMDGLMVNAIHLGSYTTCTALERQPKPKSTKCMPR